MRPVISELLNIISLAITHDIHDSGTYINTANLLQMNVASILNSKSKLNNRLPREKLLTISNECCRCVHRINRINLN